MVSRENPASVPSGSMRKPRTGLFPEDRMADLFWQLIEFEENGIASNRKSGDSLSRKKT
jgi:hypothetical protein